MTIDLSYDRQVFTVWFAAWPGGDVLGAVTRGPGEELWTGQFRTRYYSKDSVSPWDDKDEKSWYTVTGPDPEVLRTGLLEVCKAGVSLLGLQFTLFEELPVKATGKEALAALQKCSWAHGRKITLEKPHG